MKNYKVYVLDRGFIVCDEASNRLLYDSKINIESPVEFKFQNNVENSLRTSAEVGENVSVVHFPDGDSRMWRGSKGVVRKIFTISEDRYKALEKAYTERKNEYAADVLKIKQEAETKISVLRKLEDRLRNSERVAIDRLPTPISLEETLLREPGE